MKRGSIVTVAAPGDFGKPRPCLVVQSDLVPVDHPSVTVVLMSTTLVDAPLVRITVEPSAHNGLRKITQVMVDKLVTVKRDKLGKEVGELDHEAMVRVNRAIGVWLGLA